MLASYLNLLRSSHGKGNLALAIPGTSLKKGGVGVSLARHKDVVSFQQSASTSVNHSVPPCLHTAAD